MTEFTVEAAYELGQTAHREGRNGIPAQDVEFCNRLAEHCKGQPIGHSLPVLEAYAQGYYMAQRAEAVQELATTGLFEDLPSVVAMRQATDPRFN